MTPACSTYYRHSDIATSGALTHRYYVRDYLGSTRAVIDEEGNVLQSTAYYPSGVPLTPNELTPQTIKLHTGKDYFDLQGAGWYDNQARYYDCLIPTFKSQDPLAEKYPWLSPYNHCANNPLKFVDLKGDSLTLSGDITNINKTLDIYSKGTNDVYKFTINKNGLVSMQLSEGKDHSELTPEGKKFYNTISQIVNDDKTTSLTITNGTSDIIANISTATIDIADVKNLNSELNSSSILIHETYEQFLKQTKNKSDKEAHERASGVELYIYNQAAPAYERNINSNPNGGGTLDITIRNIYNQIVKQFRIPFNSNNNF